MKGMQQTQCVQEMLTCHTVIKRGFKLENGVKFSRHARELTFLHNNCLYLFILTDNNVQQGVSFYKEQQLHTFCCKKQQINAQSQSILKCHLQHPAKASVVTWSKLSP